METVKRFVNDKHMLNDVQNAVIDILEKEIVLQAYQGNDVAPFAKAKGVLVKALVQLENEYGVKKKIDKVDHSE